MVLRFRGFKLLVPTATVTMVVGQTNARGACSENRDRTTISAVELTLYYFSNGGCLQRDAAAIRFTNSHLLQPLNLSHDALRPAV